MSERRVHGINEGVYQATARAYWFSPSLVGRIGQRQQRDESSLGYLLDLMEEVQSDVAALHMQAAYRLAQHAKAPAKRSPRSAGGRRAGKARAEDRDLPSLGVSGEIRVRPEQRPEFMADLKAALQGIFTKYGDGDGDAFRLAAACYPDRHDMQLTQDDTTVGKE